MDINDFLQYTADGKSAFTVALHELEAMAHLKGFEVYDVP